MLLVAIINASSSPLIDFNKTTFALTPNGQAWPRALNTLIGGNTEDVYLVVNDIGTPSGEGLDFINGQTFLYVIFPSHSVPLVS